MLALLALVPGVGLAQVKAPPPGPMPVAPTSSTSRLAPVTTAQPAATPAQPAPATANPAPVSVSRPPDAVRTLSLEPSCAQSAGAGYTVDSSGSSDACVKAPVQGRCTTGATVEVDKSGQRDECSKPWPLPIGNTDRSPCKGVGVQLTLPGPDQCRPTAAPECLIAGARAGTLLVGAGRDKCGPVARCEALPIHVDAVETRDLCFTSRKPRCDGASTLAVDHCRPMMGFSVGAGCTGVAVGGGAGSADFCKRVEGSETKLSAPTCPAGTNKTVRTGEDECRSTPQPSAVCPAGTRLVPRAGPDDCLP